MTVCGFILVCENCLSTEHFGLISLIFTVLQMRWECKQEGAQSFSFSLPFSRCHNSFTIESEEHFRSPVNVDPISTDSLLPRSDEHFTRLLSPSTHNVTVIVL